MHKVKRVKIYCTDEALGREEGRTLTRFQNRLSKGNGGVALIIIVVRRWSWHKVGTVAEH